jgi:hypothetical protein
LSRLCYRSKPSGGPVVPFLPRGISRYEHDLAEARKVLKQEELKIGLFRNYDRVRDNFRQVLQEGER